MAKKKSAKKNKKVETESAYASMGVTIPSSVNFGGARYDLGVTIRCPELSPEDALQSAQETVQGFMEGSVKDVFAGLNEKIKKTVSDAKRGK